jgi:hypothetical protein
MQELRKIGFCTGIKHLPHWRKNEHGLGLSLSVNYLIRFCVPVILSLVVAFTYQNFAKNQPLQTSSKNPVVGYVPLLTRT